MSPISPGKLRGRFLPGLGRDKFPKPRSHYFYQYSAFCPIVPKGRRLNMVEYIPYNSVLYLQLPYFSDSESYVDIPTNVISDSPFSEVPLLGIQVSPLRQGMSVYYPSIRLRPFICPMEFERSRAPLVVIITFPFLTWLNCPLKERRTLNIVGMCCKLPRSPFVWIPLLRL